MRLHFFVNYPDFGDLFADLAAAGRQGGSVANLLMGDYAGLARERGGIWPGRSWQACLKL